MKTVQSIDKIKIQVNKDDLIEGKWLNYQLLSKKLGIIEQEKGIGYKTLRNKLYNSTACQKYNVKEIAGLKCIDVDNPMKGTASLSIEFEKV